MGYSNLIVVPKDPEFVPNDVQLKLQSALLKAGTPGMFIRLKPCSHKPYG